MSEYPPGSTAKQYSTSDGMLVPLRQMIREENEWAHTRIVQCEIAEKRIKELEAAITDVLDGKIFDECGNREGGGLSEYPYDKPVAKQWMVEHLRAVQEPGQ